MDTKTKIVPNEHPKFLNQPYRIAFIGEAPGAHEEDQGRPFVGPSGNLLWGVAAKYGIVREACFVGNVCQVRPPNNKIELFAFNGPEITDGLATLNVDLDTFKPNLCVLLGNTALRAFTGETGINSWRGSLLRGNKGFKVLPTLHPAAILREYSGLPLLHFDIQRARREAERPELDLPQRDLAVDLALPDVLDRLDDIIQRKPVISIDLEGYWNNMWCISLAESPSNGFLVEFNNTLSLEDECQLWQRLATIMSDPEIGKIAQNAAYELFVLQYGHQIPIRGIVDDTMLAHWELYCELEKRLSLQASIYTREPFWKDEREDEDAYTRKIYCCKDSAVTYEIRDVLRPRLVGPQLDHYKFNLALLDPIIYMECKGINYDKTKAQEKATDCTEKVHRLQWALNEIAGIRHPSSVAEWVDVCRAHLCFKKSSGFVNLVSDIVPHSKLTTLHLSKRAVEILQQGQPTITSSGELSILTEQCLNVESKLQVADFLYRQLGLPVQFKKEHGRNTEKETTDVLALLTLFEKTQDPTLKLILTIRGLRTRLDTLCKPVDPDNRMRCGYNIVGTKHGGRISCNESPTGSGFNLQTVQKKDRDLFKADDGYWMFQCDLSGADGWTVAAQCYSLGDDTMIEDLRAGLKSAKILALARMHGAQALKWPRDKLKELSETVDKDGWLYDSCKRVQHGSTQGMRPIKISSTILTNSFKFGGKVVYVAPSICDQLQRFYFARYPGILRYQEKVRHQLKTHGYIISANGNKCIFFGRKDDQNTLRIAYSHEPQTNTTYAANLALLKLWTDPDNRLSRPTTETGQQAVQATARVDLRIQPLHQVHDALIGQFKKSDSAWACGRIRSYFANELCIAGVNLVIPFEGSYGASWGQLKEGVI